MAVEDLPVTDGSEKIYDIVFRNSFDEIAEELEKIHASEKYNRMMIVTDSNVGPLYSEKLQSVLKNAGFSADTFVLPAGEDQKNLNSIEKIYQALVSRHFDRKSLLIALGGGVIGDMTGFAAATYLRGVDFIQVPTTLLSQVDSSVGGKTGVDFHSYKNMVGAFYMPRLVYMDSEVYQTLPREQFSSGMGEVVKYGFIQDRDFLDWLQQNRKDVLSLTPDALSYVVRKSCDCKRRVVEIDPKEHGIRATLNFGHTIGHAIEKLMNFKLFHGHCVGLGMMAALAISERRGLITSDEVERARELLDSYEIPTVLHENSFTAKDVLETTKSDKKRDGSHIRFILLNGIGNAIIDETVTDEELLYGIESILQ